MARDFVVLVLFLIAGILGWLAWFQIRSERIETGRWIPWPLTLGWRLAGALLALAIAMVELGLLAAAGDGAVSWLLMAPFVHLAVWLLALWWEFRRGGTNGH